MKKIIMLIPALLVACASKPQSMPDGLYQRFAATRVFSSLCLNKNMISPQDVAQANFNISAALNTWSYFPQKLMDTQTNIERQMKEHWGNYDKPQDQADIERSCNQLKARIYQDTLELQNLERTQQIRAQQDAVASQQLNQTIQNMPKTTYCNNIAGTVLCNTY